MQNNENIKTTNLKREDIVPPGYLNRPKGLPTFVYRRFVGGALPDRDVLKKEKSGDG
jgi:hypothetical protein